MVNCESCKKILTEKNLNELEDCKKKLHLICKHCKKQAELVLDTFGKLEWDAFVLFVNRQKEEMSYSSFDIPVSRK